MTIIEKDNLFEVAKARGLEPQEVVEILISNGRDIYVHFLEEHLGTIEFEGLKKVEETMTYKIESGLIFPLTPNSRIDLVKALNEKKETHDLQFRKQFDDDFPELLIIKVNVNLMSNLVIDFKDSQFLPPLSSIKGRPSVSGSSSPPKFFPDNNFHQLILRTMRKEGTHWNVVKRNLNKHTLDGENIKIIEVSNHEGEMRPQIQFDAEGFIEPYKIIESTFRKSLIAYRNHLNKLPLPGNK